MLARIVRDGTAAGQALLPTLHSLVWIDKRCGEQRAKE